MNVTLQSLRCRLEATALESQTNAKLLGEIIYKLVEQCFVRYTQHPGSFGMHHGDGWLFDFLLLPLVDVAKRHKELASPFVAIRLIAEEVKRWNTAKPVVVALALTLDAIISLLSASETCSVQAFDAMAAIVQTLRHMLKPTAVIYCVDACLQGLKVTTWEHRVAAMKALASILETVADVSKPGTKPIPLETSAADLIGLTAAVIYRHAAYDASMEVRQTAMAATTALEPSLRNDANLPSCSAYRSRQNGTTGSANGGSILPRVSEVANPLAAKHPSVSLQVDVGALGEFDDVQMESPLLQLASAPLPRFCSPAKQDHSTSSFTVGIDERSVGTHSDLFSLGSDGASSLGGPIDVDVAEFLRGSIMPADWLGSRNVETDCCRVPKDCKDTASGTNAISTQVDLQQDSSGDDLPVNLLHAAWKAHFGAEQACKEWASVTTEEIQGVLAAALDIQSDNLYSKYIEHAEVCLEEEAQRAAVVDEAALARRARALEAQVHMHVAEELGQFMDSMLPRLADALANPSNFLGKGIC
jgi:hypothetical protein